MQRRCPNRCVKVLRAGDVGVGRVGMLSCLVKFSLVPGKIHASRLQLADLPRLRHPERGSGLASMAPGLGLGLARTNTFPAV